MRYDAIAAALDVVAARIAIASAPQFAATTEWRRGESSTTAPQGQSTPAVPHG